MATPSGEQPIASLQVGDAVTAYDPDTGQASTQTVEHVWINHDDDLIDLTLQNDSASYGSAATDASRKQQEAEVAAHGLRAPPPTASDNRGKITATNETQTTDLSVAETVHTTAKHPWLTADRVWRSAGQLQVVEQIQRADGNTATVVCIHSMPGAADMWNLAVANVQTFAVC